MTSLLNTILQWNATQCLNENLYKDHVRKLPLEFESIEQWSTSFQDLIYEETRACLGKALENFEIPRSNFIIAESAARVPSENLFSKLQCSIEIPRELFGERLVFFVKSGRIELNSDNLTNFPNFIACMAVLPPNKRNSDVGLGKKENASLSYFCGVHQEDFVKNQGKGWNLYVLDESYIPAQRILDGLSESPSWKLPVDLANNLLTGALRDTNLLTNTECTESPPYADARLSRLNSSQQLSIARALEAGRSGSHIQLIRGPPGTGKTATLVVLIGALLITDRQCRVLVTATTNQAISELATRSLSLTRSSGAHDAEDAIKIRHLVLVGNSERLKMNPELKSFHLDNIIELLTIATAQWSPTFTKLKSLLFPSYRDDEQEEEMKEEEDLADSLEECFLQCAKLAMVVSRRLPDSHISSETRVCIDAVSEVMQSLIDLRQPISPSPAPSDLLMQLKDLLYSGLFCYFSGSSFMKLNQWLKKKCIVESARAVFCTVSEAGSSIMSSMRTFDSVILDEATQLVEASIGILLSSSVRRMVLVGDIMQLPPTVISNLAGDHRYGISLFARLLSLNFPSTLLEIQYRMHPRISQWPNQRNYGETLINGPNVLSEEYSKVWHDYLPPFSVFDVRGVEELTVTKSFINRMEVSVLKSVLRHLYTILVKEYDDCTVYVPAVVVGVILPYKDQCSLTTQALRDLQKSFNGSVIELKSSTVDGFQGQECDIIIILCTRSNAEGDIGFLNNRQRLNVALTRAKYSLLVIGNCSTFKKKSGMWRSLIESAADRECLSDAKTSKTINQVAAKFKSDELKLKNLKESVASEIFESTPWWKKLKLAEEIKRTFPSIPGSGVDKRGNVLLLLERISSGNWPSRTMNAAGIEGGGFEGIVFSCVCFSEVLLWSVDLEITDKRKKLYHQVLKIWDLVTPHEALKLSNRVAKSYSGRSKHYLDRCRKLTKPPHLPDDDCFFAHEEINSSKADADKAEGEGEAEAEQSCANQKQFTLNSSIARSLYLASEHSRLDFPHDISTEESSLVHSNSSQIVCGRSGTGKTTVMLHRMLLNDIASRTVEDNDPLPQMLVTRSPVLAKAIESNYRNMLGSSLTDRELAQAVGTSDLSAMRLDRLQPQDYPLIQTYDAFLRMLDRTLPTPFFSEPTRRTTLVDLPLFESYYFGHLGDLTSGGKFKVDACGLFTEIMCVIKGRMDALKSPQKVMQREAYVHLSKSRSSIGLSEDERHHYYTLFEAYTKKAAHEDSNSHYDTADFVAHVYSALSTAESKYSGVKMEYVYVDEVQDLTPGQICILKFVCANPQGFFFAGDTAQTIASGVEFRFDSLKDLYYSEFNTRKGSMPDVYMLTRNYRTHKSILNVANVIIALLKHFFPTSIDNYSEEESFVLGPKPVYLSDTVDVVSALFKGGEINHEFGSDQVILVKDIRAKDKLRLVCGDSALVLTVEEAKGMEFTDCLLYNFFSCAESQSSSAWRFIRAAYKGLKVPNSENVKFPRFDFSEHKEFITELKKLYVLVTRAKRNLIFFDEDPTARAPFLDLLRGLKLVNEKKLDDDLTANLTEQNDPVLWCKRGEEFFERKNFTEARLCFTRGGDVFKRTLCDAELVLIRALAFKGKSLSQSILESARSQAKAEANTCFLQAAELFETPPLELMLEAANAYRQGGEYMRAAKLFISLQDNINAAECYCLSGEWTEAGYQYVLGRRLEKAVEVCLKANMFKYCLNLIDGYREETLDEAVDPSAGASTADTVGADGKPTTYNDTDQAHTDLPTVPPPTPTPSPATTELRDKVIAKAASYYVKVKDIDNMMTYVSKMPSDKAKKFLSVNKLYDLQIVLELRDGNFKVVAALYEAEGNYSLAIDNYLKAGMPAKSATVAMKLARMELLDDNFLPTGVTTQQRAVVLRKAVDNVLAAPLEAVSSRDKSAIELERHLLKNHASLKHDNFLDLKAKAEISSDTHRLMFMSMRILLRNMAKSTVPCLNNIGVKDLPLLPVDPLCGAVSTLFSTAKVFQSVLSKIESPETLRSDALRQCEEMMECVRTIPQFGPRTYYVDNIQAALKLFFPPPPPPPSPVESPRPPAASVPPMRTLRTAPTPTRAPAPTAATPAIERREINLKLFARHSLSSLKSALAPPAQLLCTQMQQHLRSAHESHEDRYTTFKNKIETDTEYDPKTKKRVLLLHTACVSGFEVIDMNESLVAHVTQCYFHELYLPLPMMEDMQAITDLRASTSLQQCMRKELEKRIVNIPATYKAVAETLLLISLVNDVNKYDKYKTLYAQVSKNDKWSRSLQAKQLCSAFLYEAISAQGDFAPGLSESEFNRLSKDSQKSASLDFFLTALEHGTGFLTLPWTESNPLCTDGIPSKVNSRVDCMPPVTFIALVEKYFVLSIVYSRKCEKLSLPKSLVVDILSSNKASWASMIRWCATSEQHGDRYYFIIDLWYKLLDTLLRCIERVCDMKKWIAASDNSYVGNAETNMSLIMTRIYNLVLAMLVNLNKNGNLRRQKIAKLHEIVMKGRSELSKYLNKHLLKFLDNFLRNKTLVAPGSMEVAALFEKQGDPLVLVTLSASAFTRIRLGRAVISATGEMVTVTILPPYSTSASTPSQSGDVRAVATMTEVEGTGEWEGNGDDEGAEVDDIRAEGKTNKDPVTPRSTSEMSLLEDSYSVLPRKSLKMSVLDECYAILRKKGAEAQSRLARCSASDLMERELEHSFRAAPLNLPSKSEAVRSYISTLKTALLALKGRIDLIVRLGLAFDEIKDRGGLDLYTLKEETDALTRIWEEVTPHSLWGGMQPLVAAPFDSDSILTFLSIPLSKIETRLEKIKKSAEWKEYIDIDRIHHRPQGGPESGPTAKPVMKKKDNKSNKKRR